MAEGIDLIDVPYYIDTLLGMYVPMTKKTSINQIKHLVVLLFYFFF